MSDAILVLNAGSSSIKFSLFEAHARPSRQGLICDGACEGIGHRVHFTAKDRAGASLVDQYLAEGTTHEDALSALLRWLETHFQNYRLVAAGHRVVHGGSLYTAPVRIDASVIAELRRLIPLAPLHQPHHLAAIAALSKLYPLLRTPHSKPVGRISLNIIGTFDHRDRQAGLNVHVALRQIKCALHER